jgi:hypothetical protein
LCYRLQSTKDLDDWTYLYVSAKGARLEVMIRSDFGCYEYTWSNIGPGDWREFLINLDNDYLLGKLAPDVFRLKRGKRLTEVASFIRLVWPRVKDMLMKDLQSEGRSPIIIP